MTDHTIAPTTRSAPAGPPQLPGPARSLPVRLPVPGESRTDGRGSALTRDHDVRGLLSLRGTALLLEWSGTTHVSEVRGHAAETRREPFPSGWRLIPLAAVASIRRRGWWWRPRLELRVHELELARGVPGSHGPVITVRVARADLQSAGELAIAARLSLPAIAVHNRATP